MQRKDVKVGEVYAVMRKQGGEPFREAVGAEVISLDATYMEPMRHGGLSGEERYTPRPGGIEIRFVEPTRVGWRAFNLAARTNENAGKIADTFVYPPDMGARGIVCPWAEMVERRTTAERRTTEARATAKQQADEFAPVLAEYRARLKRVGLDTTVHTDGSGITGDVSVDLRNAIQPGKGQRRAATGLGYGVTIPREAFDRLVEIADAHGEKI